MPVPGRDERVAARQPQGGEAAVSERIRSISSNGLLVEHRNLELPDHRALLAVVLADEAVAFVAHQDVAVLEDAHEARIRARVGRGDLQRDLALDRAQAVDLDDPRRTALGDHDVAVRERLE